MVLWENDNIIERWKGYYGKLLIEEHPRRLFRAMECQTEVLTLAISRQEVEVALKGMKMGGDGTRRNSSGGLEELGRRRGIYVRLVKDTYDDDARTQVTTMQYRSAGQDHD